MSATINASNARDELQTLRDQVNHLMDDKITPAIVEAVRQATETALQARDATRDYAAAASGRVQERPLLAVSLAAAVGYLFGRMTR